MSNALAEQLNDEPHGEEPELKKKEILLVDDEVGLLNRTASRLTERGYQLHMEMNGTSAIDLLQNSSPDLVVSDIKMPGCTGIELLKWVKDLGVQEMALERLTGNGNALLHPEIFPTNLEQDQWFLKMHEQIVEHDARHWFDNEFMETIYNKFETGFLKGGTFCRDCEEKLYTINADGTLSGCPNAAPEEQFGHINDDIKSLINSPKRIKNIACERSRDPRCYECPVFMYCGGDCHQLAWQGDTCGAPKSLMKLLKAQKHGNI